jgi:hypothetical protein
VWGTGHSWQQIPSGEVSNRYAGPHNHSHFDPILSQSNPLYNFTYFDNYLDTTAVLIYQVPTELFHIRIIFLLWHFAYSMQHIGN